MSGNFVQRINGDPATVNVNQPVIAPGAIVADESGATSAVGIVYRTSPTANAVLVLETAVLGIVSVTWTPGAGGSGGGNIDILVQKTGAVAVEDALVNVGLIAEGTIVGIITTAGALTARAISGTGADSGAIVQGLTASNGHLTLAFAGATGTGLKIVVSLLPSIADARLDNVVNTQDVTLP